MISDTLYPVAIHLNALNVKFHTLVCYKTKRLSYPNLARNSNPYHYNNVTASRLILCDRHLALQFANFAKYLNLFDTHAEKIPLLVGTASHPIKNILNDNKRLKPSYATKRKYRASYSMHMQNLKLNGANHEKRCHSSLPKITSDIRT